MGLTESEIWNSNSDLDPNPELPRKADSWIKGYKTCGLGTETAVTVPSPPYPDRKRAIIEQSIKKEQLTNA